MDGAMIIKAGKIMAVEEAAFVEGVIMGALLGVTIALFYLPFRRERLIGQNNLKISSK